MSRARNWCFTSFAMDSEPSLYMDEKIVRYMVYGREKCPNTGKEHWQGYMELHEAKTLSAIKKWWKQESLHLEAAKGDAKSNTKYCTKEGNYKTFGTAKMQGQRNDLNEVVQEISNGTSYDEIAEYCPQQFIKFSKGIREAINCRDRKKQNIRDVHVTVLIGPSGCGKTSYVFDTEKSLFMMTIVKSLWFDGYEQQPAILFDEMGEEQVPWETLLSLLDVYPTRLPIKGSFAYAQWNRVYITSNLPVGAWFPQREGKQLEPLFRRIHTIHEIGRAHV